MKEEETKEGRVGGMEEWREGWREEEKIDRRKRLRFVLKYYSFVYIII